MGGRANADGYLLAELLGLLPLPALSTVWDAQQLRGAAVALLTSLSRCQAQRECATCLLLLRNLGWVILALSTLKKYECFALLQQEVQERQQS